MLRPAVAILVALSLAVIAFVALAPASLLDRRLAVATAGRLRLSDTEGSVWRGRGVVTDDRGEWRVPVAWRVAPLALLRGELEWAFVPSADGSGPRGTVTLRENGVELQNTTLAVPAVAFQSWSRELPLPQAGGDLRFDAPRFRFDFRSGEGAIDLRWERARLVWNGTLLNLGTLNGRVAPRGADLAGSLDNSGGAARVNGDFVLSSSGIDVRATIVPGPDVPPEIARGLAALGTPDGSGGVRVAWRSGKK